MPLAPSLPRSLVILILVLIYLSLTAGSARSVSASSQRKAYELVYSSARSASASSQRKMHCRAVLILFLLTASIRQNITVRSTSSFLSLRGQRRSYVNTLSCGPHFHSLRSASRQYIALRVVFLRSREVTVSLCSLIYPSRGDEATCGHFYKSHRSCTGAVTS